MALEDELSKSPERTDTLEDRLLRGPVPSEWVMGSAPNKVAQVGQDGLINNLFNL